MICRDVLGSVMNRFLVKENHEVFFCSWCVVLPIVPMLKLVVLEMLRVRVGLHCELCSEDVAVEPLRRWLALF